MGLLFSVSNFRIFRLNGNRLSSIKALRILNPLIEFDLFDNPIADVSPFASATSIITPVADGNRNTRFDAVGEPGRVGGAQRRR